jgi:hypothetical protein
MSENTNNPLAAVVAMEATAFRIGQVARRLLAEHSDGIHVESAQVHGWADGDIHPVLRLQARDADSARSLATALGMDLEISDITGGNWRPYRSIHGETEIDGIPVSLRALDYLPEDEAAAWLAEQGQATEGGEG